MSINLYVSIVSFNILRRNIMEALVTYDFICTNKIEDTFQLKITREEEDFKYLSWLLSIF